MLIALAVGFAVLAWWGSTAAILYLDALPRPTHKWSLGAMTLLALGAVAGLGKLADDASVPAAFAGFAAALVAWGWQEMSFYTGFVTGPRPAACRPDSGTASRFAQAVGALLWHELAIAATAAVILWTTWGHANAVGAWTFLALWWMRQSAKLNVFLGVRNLHEELLPEHLGFLASYFTRRAMNPLLPVSVAAAAALSATAAAWALADDATPFEQAGYALVATIVALALVEHVMLVLPLPRFVVRLLGLTPRPAGGVRPVVA